MPNEQKAQSIFPDVPRQIPVVDKTGDFASLWSLFFSSVSQALQRNFKNEGIVFPPLTAAQMASIQSLYTSYVGGSYNALTTNLPDISGQTVYDSTTQISNQFIVAQDNVGNVTLAEWVPITVMLTYAGNPNGHVAGVLNWLCYDSASVTLYICTAGGSMITAVWSAL